MANPLSNCCCFCKHVSVLNNLIGIRMRKQQHTDGLTTQMTQLLNENNVIADQINSVTNIYVGLESENNVLRAQLAELTDQLRSLNSVLQIAEEVSGLSMDIPEIPDILLEPWQIPCPMTQLQNENNVIADQINSVANIYVGLESENNVLRAQLAELTDRLRSLNSVLQIAEEVSGLSMDIPEIPDILLEPWQIPCPMAASASMFQC